MLLAAHAICLRSIPGTLLVSTVAPSHLSTFGGNPSHHNATQHNATQHNAIADNGEEPMNGIGVGHNAKTAGRVAQVRQLEVILDPFARCSQLDP